MMKKILLCVTCVGLILLLVGCAQLPADPQLTPELPGFLPTPIPATQVATSTVDEAVPALTATLKTKTEPTPVPGYAITRHGEVNLHSGPGVDYPVVGTMLPGNRLSVLGVSSNGEWLEVNYFYTDSGIAWVFLHSVIQVEESVPDEQMPELKMTASNLRHQGDRLFVDVCYETPDNRDWTIFDALFRYENGSRQVEEPLLGSSLISLQKTGEGTNKGQRCDTLEFRLWSELEISNSSLAVLSIGAYPREGMTCAWYLAEVQSHLDAQAKSIQIDCEEVPHSFKLTVVKWPDSISQAEAEGVVYQVFLASISQKGPWIFPLEQGDLAPSPAADTSGSNPALLGLQELQNLRVSNLMVPGWMHLLTHEMQQSSAPSLPMDYKTDAWYELDEQMQIARSVVRKLDPEGKELQVQVLMDGTWYNQSAGESTPQDLTKAFELDFGFTALATTTCAKGGKLIRSPLYFEGTYVGDQYIIENGKARTEGLFNPYSGMLRSLMTWRVIPGGTEWISSVSIDSFEVSGELPPALQVYLNP
jgi:hypothetical protein